MNAINLFRRRAAPPAIIQDITTIRLALLDLRDRMVEEKARLASRDAALLDLVCNAMGHLNEGRPSLALNVLHQILVKLS